MPRRIYTFHMPGPTVVSLGVVLACASSLLVSADQTAPTQRPVAAAASAGSSRSVAAISGVWDYNKNLSVDAATGKPEQTPQSATQGRRGGASASSGGGGGGTTPATSGGGSSLDWERRMEAMFIAERRALVGDLMEVPEILTIRVTNESVTFVDDLKRERTYPTDGKLRKYQIGAAQFEARASWDGTRFRKDIEGSNGFRMSEVYFLGEDGNRLIVVLRIGDPKKVEAQFGVNRVYDRVTLPALKGRPTF